MNQTRLTTCKAFSMKVWHFAAALFGVGLCLRVGLGAMPGLAVFKGLEAGWSKQKIVSSVDTYGPLMQPAIEVLPFDMQGEVPGPLLTEILQRYLPDSTPDHADELRDTLPPCDDPRMIVIIPDEEEPVF